jgi:hypothetical protein
LTKHYIKWRKRRIENSRLGIDFEEELNNYIIGTGFGSIKAYKQDPMKT